MPERLGVAAGKTGFRTARLDSTAANMGDMASIILHVCFTGESAFFKLCVKVHWPAVGAGAQVRAIRQFRERFENFYHGFRWFEATRVHFYDFGCFGIRPVAERTFRRNKHRGFTIPAGEQHFPITRLRLFGFMIKTLPGQNGKKRRRFKRSYEQKFLVRAQLLDGIHDFREWLASPAQILPNIQRDDIVTHNVGEGISGLESVSSMENCFVALTACGRCGGM